MTSQTVNQVSIHAVSNFAPDTAWVHTHGMTEFEFPDLEWYWSPAATHAEASRILKKLAGYLLEDGDPVEVGDIINLPEEGMILQLLEPLAHEASDFGGGPVLRVQSLTTGEEGAGLFRDLVCGATPPPLLANKRAVNLQLRGRYFEAWQEYSKVIRDDPHNVQAINNLGHLMLSCGHTQDALSLFNKAVALAPDYALAHNNLGNARLQLGEVDAAVECYRRAAELLETYAMPHRNLALALHLLGRRDEAVAEYRSYFRMAPAGTRDADAHFNLGVMLEECGRSDEAVAEYERALADDPRHAKALNNLGLVMFTHGEIGAAVGHYRRALETDEEFALARYNLGVALVARGEHEEAAKEFEHVVANAPDNVQAASNLGVLYTTLGRCDAAVEIFERLVAAVPSQPTLRFNLALAYRGQGLVEQADAELRAVIGLEPPGSPRAERAQRELVSAS